MKPEGEESICSSEFSLLLYGWDFVEKSGDHLLLLELFGCNFFFSLLKGELILGSILN